MKLLKALKKSQNTLLLLTCIGLIVIVCYCLNKNRDNFYSIKDGNYRGTVNVTKNGLDCQKWTSQTPHKHSRTPTNYPGKGLGNHNYCRNPDNEPGGAWCYTTDSAKRWEYCDISDEPTYNECIQNCSDETIDGKRLFTDIHCNEHCKKFKSFKHPDYTLDELEEFTNLTTAEADTYVSHSNCIKTCLNDEHDHSICLPHCAEWALQYNKKLETCYFRPGGLTPGDCKTRCEDYYNLFNDDICIKTCESTCKKCQTSDCKWTNFQSEEEFPYQLSLFGVPGNKKVKISWEKPPYAVKKYIIMYFEEEKQHETGVKFVEKYGSQCDSKDYCSHTIRGLKNNTNYIIGVSIVFQNNNITRMSNRLVMRPEVIITQTKENEIEEVSNNESIQEDSTTQTQTPTEILTGALLREKHKANSQKILTDFKKSQSEHVSDLFSYLATNPINLQFKLS